MNIITIGREFGSGGRELGKRLADALGYAYYDRQIITSIAKKKEMSAEYVEDALELNSLQNFAFTFRNSFASDDVMQSTRIDLYTEQRKVIEEIAAKGKNCVIVGRNADVLLEKYHPFSIFVCASTDARVKRCLERTKEGEQLTEKQIRLNMKRIDKNRATSRNIITEKDWGERTSYDLIINTTGREIKQLVPAVAEYAKAWFQAEI